MNAKKHLKSENFNEISLNSKNLNNMDNKKYDEDIYVENLGKRKYCFDDLYQTDFDDKYKLKKSQFKRKNCELDTNIVFSSAFKDKRDHCTLINSEKDEKIENMNILNKKSKIKIHKQHKFKIVKKDSNRKQIKNKNNEIIVHNMQTGKIFSYI